ncbi:MAG: imidazole glycerol phosphate synthase subunit HisH [Sphingobacteriaceae bacterium]|nr:imidazole glycerol phosphate synthase subunit HisH [Sphingobacteriaceae bacterium]
MIGIINYGAGNIFSLTAALNRQNIAFGMINKPEEIDLYSHLIIPGVGHAGLAMQKLQESMLVEDIKKTTKPVLGICVGMQLLTQSSEEGNCNLLNIFPLKTLLFDKKLGIKIPHMGWNEIYFNSNPLFEGIKTETQFYFVHSYYIEQSEKYSIAKANYGLSFSAAIQKDNFYGVQFHPEKSGIAGEQLLKNFSQI